ncbi:hypothetical protein [Sulfodiicoccus acidiphilus]|uniref:hypothetical protein n=1 Tax=Sulfodiicoccus acidiphilus TaxID=1670455 RepID=UPI000F84D59F|nr:hypothetical protein [Sulfodiicoccus acidiphilus]
MGVDQESLREVYARVDQLIAEELGTSLMPPNCPIFGESLSIHTPGTHVTAEEFRAAEFSVNVYCGRTTVKRIVEERGISVDDEAMRVVTSRVKDRSASTGRVLTYDEVVDIAKEVLQRR